MKRLLILCTLLAGLFISCNEDVTPEIPVIYEYDLTVLDKAQVPVSDAVVNIYMTHKPDFVVMSRTTDIFGKVHFLNLQEREYIFEAVLGDTELFKQNVQVTADNEKNVSTISSPSFQSITSELKVCIKSDRGQAIAHRKVDLVTKEEGILFKTGSTDEHGELLFTQLPPKDYVLHIYDDLNQIVFMKEEVQVGKDATKNVANVEIVKLLHHSDIVITGMLVDPKGSDSPKPGTTSGGGWPHVGGYEYIQLMALKDINFEETPYCVITGMNATKPTDSSYPAAVNGWIQSKVSPSKTTYQMNLTTGSVKKGQFFYVGGKSYRIASYYDNWGSEEVDASRWWAFDWYSKGGDDGNGKAKGGSGIFNNFNGDKVTNVPDGVAVFKGIEIDQHTVPQDCVFYGGDSPIRKEDRYLITDNDLYQTISSKGEAQPYFGDGTNTWFARQAFHDDGCYFMMGGAVSKSEWIKPRVGKAVKLNCKAGASSVTIADIETGDAVTKFIDE